MDNYHYAITFVDHGDSADVVSPVEIDEVFFPLCLSVIQRDGILTMTFAKTSFPFLMQMSPLARAIGSIPIAE